MVETLQRAGGREGWRAGRRGRGRENCSTCELAAELPRFLLRFDTADHDPARATVELRDFLARMHVLFVEGYVLCESGATPATCRDAGRAQTITEIAMAQRKAPLRPDAQRTAARESAQSLGRGRAS